MQTWLVTGASRGLGRALCLQLAARGHRVLALARDARRLAQMAAAATGGQIVPCPINLADPQQVTESVARLLAEQSQIDGLVNNAGIGAYLPFSEHTDAQLRDIIQVNLTAPIQLCHAVLPRMLAQGSGQIINIGSDLGRRPLANMAAYVASKHGLTGFSHSLLREVKDHGIRVSLINPGIIDTDFGGGTEGSRDPRSAMQVETLAALVLQVIEQAETVVVDEVSVHPLGQRDF